MNTWIPLVTLAGLGLFFAVFSVGVASLTGPKRYNRAKLDAYECGIEPTRSHSAVASSPSSTTSPR